MQLKSSIPKYITPKVSAWPLFCVCVCGKTDKPEKTLATLTQRANFKKGMNQSKRGQHPKSKWATNKNNSQKMSSS